MEPVLSPLSLAASLNVTSSASRDLMPVVQASFTADVIPLTLVNDAFLLGSRTPACLRPFRVTDDALIGSKPAIELKLRTITCGVRTFTGHERVIDAQVQVHRILQCMC